MRQSNNDKQPRMLRLELAIDINSFIDSKPARVLTDLSTTRSPPTFPQMLQMISHTPRCWHPSHAANDRLAERLEN